MDYSGTTCVIRAREGPSVVAALMEIFGTMLCPPGPPCGPIFPNQKVEALLQVVKPEIQTLKEKLNMVGG